MDSKNQLTKQYKGFLDTPAIFEKCESFELFSFSEENDAVFNKIALKTIPENLVLGKRVELFFHEFINHSNRYSVLAANLQIIENKVTLGELDYLIKDIINNRFLHVEMVYKFYLYDPKIDGELQRWIGPNRRDTLLYKIRKLRNKQLPLLQNKITQKYLKDMNFPYKDFNQQVCFLGKLYVPIELNGRILPEINNSSIVGFWQTLDSFIDRHREDDIYSLPKKENWLLHPEENDVWISFKDSVILIEKSLQKKKSLLCWKKTSKNRYEQFFVVWW